METKTELIFILDRSGSMAGLEADTIGGFNAMLKKQQCEPGEAMMTTVLFDDKTALLHDRADIQSVQPITEKEYFVGGSTALLDAMGEAIHRIIRVQRDAGDGLRTEKVLFVITTDGQENASREYSFAQIKALVEKQTQEYGWEFIFLGANIDAIATAAHLGIGADRAANYHADRLGMQCNYEAVSGAISRMRACTPFGAEWKQQIDNDYRSRSKAE